MDNNVCSGHWDLYYEQEQKNLERWRYTVKRREPKVSNSKAEYACVNKRRRRTMRLLL